MTRPKLFPDKLWQTSLGPLMSNRECLQCLGEVLPLNVPTGGLIADLTPCSSN